MTPLSESIIKCTVTPSLSAEALAKADDFYRDDSRDKNCIEGASSINSKILIKTTTQ